MSFHEVLSTIHIQMDGNEYYVRTGFVPELDTSLLCQFFPATRGARPLFVVQFTYNFLMEYDLESFNYKNIYTEGNSIPSEVIKPFLRYSLQLFKDKIRVKDNKPSQIKISSYSYSNKSLLDDYKYKKCEHFENYKCKINVSDVPTTTDIACTKCSHPEYYEQCPNLLSGQTKGVAADGTIDRVLYGSACKKGNKVEDVARCRYLLNRCFIPPNLQTPAPDSKKTLIMIGSRCEEFSSDRVILKEDIENEKELDGKVEVILIPESERHVPTARPIDETSIEHATDSDVYVLLIGKDCSDIVKLEYQSAIESKKTKKIKDVWVYIKKGIKRTQEGEGFLHQVKHIDKLTVMEFSDARDLRKAVIGRVKSWILG